MKTDEEFDKRQDALHQAVKEHDNRVTTGPASWAWSGPARNLVDYGYKAGQSALRRVAASRWYALDRQSAIELAALGVACTRVGRPLPQVIAEFAKVCPGWMQTERPSPDAGTLDPMPRDPNGKEIGNPYMEQTKDIGSQALLQEAAPRLAAWLKKCAEHGGAPTAKMLVEFETEKEEATQMRRVCDGYDAKAWAENKIRRDPEAWPDGFNGTTQALWTRAIEAKDKWLIRQHRAEAKAGPLRLGFHDHTLHNVLAKRDPQLREIHKAAAQILEGWQAEEQA